MKIAQIAPLWTSIPPAKYGGAELIISELTDSLVENGHEVTLFASGDSVTKAKLVSVTGTAPGLTKEAQQGVVNNMNHIFNMFRAIEESENFDIVHWHISKDILPIMFAAQIKTPSVITIHNHFYDEEMHGLLPIFNHYKDLKYFVSISNSHRWHFPFDFFETVYNGVEIKDFEFNQAPDDYLVWIGRFEFQKGAHLAIEAALELNLPLKLAGPIDENEYFISKIKPHLGHEKIDYVGEVDTLVKSDLLKNARVFVNPIQWDEPFGLVVPEANACGTPVVAFNRGSMSELIKNNVNGYLAEVNNNEDFISKIKAIYELPENEYRSMRQNSRKFVEEHFTIEKMVDGYEKVYEEILNQGR